VAYNNSRKPVSEHVYAETMIWQCSACNCWSRKEFMLEEETPHCPVCSSLMFEEKKNIRIE